jgi:hypothetical protein
VNKNRERIYVVTWAGLYANDADQILDRVFYSFIQAVEYVERRVSGVNLPMHFRIYEREEGKEAVHFRQIDAVGIGDDLSWFRNQTRASKAYKKAYERQQRIDAASCARHNAAVKKSRT